MKALEETNVINVQTLLISIIIEEVKKIIKKVYSKINNKIMISLKQIGE